MAAVGIVGGLGVGATIDYYRRIVAACQARGFAPDLVFNHADVRHGQALVEAGRLDALAEYLAGFVALLIAGPGKFSFDHLILRAFRGAE